MYCPDREVTRAEMAVFLLRAKHSATYGPPVTGGTFADVPYAGKEWMESWIEQFYREGITTGCGDNPLQYCPERNVTRAEMAVFLLRAKYGAVLPAASGDGRICGRAGGREGMDGVLDRAVLSGRDHDGMWRQSIAVLSGEECDEGRDVGLC